MQEESKSKIEQILGKIPEEMKKGIDGHVFSSKPVGPSSFAMKVKGPSMEPEYSEGDIVIADPDVPWEDGDDCVIISRDTKQPPLLKRLKDEGEEIRLTSLNRGHPDYVISKANLHYFWLCKVVDRIPGKGEKAIQRQERTEKWCWIPIHREFFYEIDSMGPRITEDREPRALVDPETSPQDGELCLALFHQGFTIRRLREDDKAYRLEAINPEFPDIKISKSRAEVDKSIFIDDSDIFPDLGPLVKKKEFLRKVLQINMKL